MATPGRGRHGDQCCAAGCPPTRVAPTLSVAHARRSAPTNSGPATTQAAWCQIETGPESPRRRTPRWAQLRAAIAAHAPRSSVRRGHGCSSLDCAAGSTHPTCRRPCAPQLCDRSTGWSAARWSVATSRCQTRVGTLRMLHCPARAGAHPVPARALRSTPQAIIAVFRRAKVARCRRPSSSVCTSPRDVALWIPICNRTTALS